MKRQGLYWIVMILIGWGCAKYGPQSDPVFPIDINTIFYADSINVTSPMNGDSLSDVRPMFIWETTGSKMVFVGIFTNNISVSVGQITNINDNIWAWHSGLGNGRAGAVSFDDGYDAINGILQTDRPPTLLNENTPYIWAIWAWDDGGYRITHASREMLFVTGTN